MSRSTGPILATGAIALGNAVVLNGQPVGRNIRIPVGTAIAAGLLALLEKASPDLAVAVAWLGLATVVLTRLDPGQPSPVENLQKWYSKAREATR